MKGQTFLRRAVLFAILAAVVAGVYWATADDAHWWVYVEGGPPRGRWPKFKLTLSEQWAESAVVGSLVAAPVTAALFAVRWA